MNIVEIKEWIIQHDVEKRTIESFWNNLKSYRIEQEEEFEQFFGEFDETEVQANISQIALMLGNYPDFDSNHIISYVPIIYKGSSIGLYRLYFELDGTTSDDYFTLY